MGCRTVGESLPAGRAGARQRLLALSGAVPHVAARVAGNMVNNTLFLGSFIRGAQSDARAAVDVCTVPTDNANPSFLLFAQAGAAGMGTCSVQPGPCCVGRAGGSSKRGGSTALLSPKSGSLLQAAQTVAGFGTYFLCFFRQESSVLV